MPATPPTSPNFGAPRIDVADNFDIVGDLNAVIDTFDVKAALRALLPPVGALMAHSGLVDPPAIDGIAAWLICDGREVDSSAYPALDALIGAAAPVGSGRHLYNGGVAPATAGKFLLPDTRGRVVVGKGTHASVDTVGENDGTALANRTPKHWHDADSLTANYWRNFPNGTAGGNYGVNHIDGQQGGSSWQSGEIDVIGDVGNTSGTQDAPSYIVVNYVIRVR